MAHHSLEIATNNRSTFQHLLQRRSFRPSCVLSLTRFRRCGVAITLKPSSVKQSGKLFGVQ